MKRIALIALLFILVGCSSSSNLPDQETGVWKYSDLKVVDPTDMDDPNQDIVAVFLRVMDSEIKIRVDFLDQQHDGQPYLIIVFDHGSGNADPLPFEVESNHPWNQLLIIPPNGRAELFYKQTEPVSTANIIINRDPILGAIIISLDKKSLSGWSLRTRITLFSVNINAEKAVYDESGPFFMSSIPPPLGEVKIRFWNTFQGETPAQALRAWDGAHTGPDSSRHGLKSLIDAVETTGVPVILEGLKKPENISALDYLGVRQKFRLLQDQGRIVLPPQQYSAPTDFASSTVDISDPITGRVPSISLRKLFLENAVSPRQTLWLGGDFSKSVWGNYTTALGMLAYIKNHPWIRVNGDLLANDGVKIPETEQNNPLIDEIKTQLEHSPSNEIRYTAERFLISLTTSGTSEEEALRLKYIGQIGHLLTIASWSKDRQAISDCSRDLDWDALPECILSSKNLAFVLDLQGGYISFAFKFSDGKFHQIIGPSYQLATGLSDPITWDLDRGIAADLSIIPGAFVGLKWNERVLTPAVVSSNSITLTDDQTKVQKTYQIIGNSIKFSYQGSDPDQLLIPLIVDPWVMDLSDWGAKYISSVNPGSWEWGISDQLLVTLHGDFPIDVRTFKDSSDMMRLPEDPNYAYPAGHFLPFPLALGIINTGVETSVNLSISP